MSYRHLGETIMAMNISDYERTSLGLLMARQSAPVAYNRQMETGVKTEETDRYAVDSVSLSANVPRPLTANDFRAAVNAGKTMASSGTLDINSTRRLREDRVFNALSALALMGERGTEEGMTGWPGGIPAPSSEELEEARRRLSQRLSRTEGLPDPAAAQEERLELLRRIGGLSLPESATANA